MAKRKSAYFPKFSFLELLFLLVMVIGLSVGTILVLNPPRTETSAYTVCRDSTTRVYNGVKCQLCVHGVWVNKLTCSVAPWDTCKWVSGKPVCVK